MGRSVSTPTGATAVAFTHFDLELDDSNDRDMACILFDEFVDDIRGRILGKYPSMEAEDGWLGREDRILAGK